MGRRLVARLSNLTNGVVLHQSRIRRAQGRISAQMDPLGLTIVKQLLLGQISCTVLEEVLHVYANASTYGEALLG